MLNTSAPKKDMVQILTNRFMSTSKKDKARREDLQFQIRCAMRSAGLIPGFDAYEKISEDLIINEIKQGISFTRIANTFAVDLAQVHAIAFKYMSSI